MNDENIAEARPSMLHRIGNFFSLRDDEDYEEADLDEPARGHKVVSLSRDARRAAPSEVSIFMPRSFAEVTNIADALRAKQVVIVNMQGSDRGLLQRVVDFTSGVAYTIDGKIQKLADAIYLVVPPSVGVNAAGIRDSLVADGTIDFRDIRG